MSSITISASIRLRGVAPAVRRSRLRQSERRWKKRICPGTPRLCAALPPNFPMYDIDAVEKEMLHLEKSMFERQQQLMERLDRQMAESFDGVRSLQMQSPDQPSWHYRKEQRGSGYYSSESMTVWSGKVYHNTSEAPMTPWGAPAVVLLGLTGAYVAMAARFWQQFAATRYKVHRKVQLVLLWPVLFLFNSKFRHSFIKAIQGGSSSDGISDGTSDAA